MGNCLGQEATATNESARTTTPKTTKGTKATKDSFVEVMFFPDPRIPCKAAVAGETCTQKRCRYDHTLVTNLLKVLKYLRSARKTLEVCVFSITCDEIADELIAAHKRGVKVRIITDDGQSKGKGSDVQSFANAGIPVRDDNSGTYMHNKFCVIDGRTLMNGSFNWSRQAIVGNDENLVVHAGGPIVKHFKDYFEKLWVKYEDNQWKRNGKGNGKR